MGGHGVKGINAGIDGLFSSSLVAGRLVSATMMIGLIVLALLGAAGKAHVHVNGYGFRVVRNKKKKKNKK